MSADAQKIEGRTVAYEANGEPLKGYLARDAQRQGKHPGVIVVHEWWGLNDYIRERARMVAGLGYTALAIDMYGGGKTADNPDDAGKLMNGVLADMPTAAARMKSGIARLRAESDVGDAPIGAIGYCFGGAVVLHMARTAMDVAGVASFHGSLGQTHKAQPGSIKAKILVCHGAADQFVDDAAVAAFRKEMDDARADYRFIAYEGALHGFTSREADANGEKYGLPLAYNADADQRSWEEMRKFLAEVLK